ncbi:uncharacterized protein MELLADRAFT_108123 [Melampsora larici-populina 98AG31]|uniref:Secreted protein n=1 Tax=Melampsora larici-populina (strain 98AG31 / pathotype 3-4-7) TaxID=747676 RepID=F4RS17_MELLP|nr:uncharacterized protein MELLADRAFT_108123 [Melampsora larici-populina 98AG31]EGG04776.1 secreted protein [Melampsora larici-populina 98AG31]
MRFFLACFLFLSPILVRGNMEEAVEKAVSTMQSDPGGFGYALGEKARPVADWLDADAPASGHEWESVTRSYHPSHGVPISKEEVVNWIDNDLSRIRGRGQPPRS